MPGLFLTNDENGVRTLFAAQLFDGGRGPAHVLTITRVEQLDIVTVGQEDTSYVARIQARTRQLRLQNVRVKMVDFG